MLKYFRPFRKADDGAVTVDWVVLTAAIVGMAMGVVGIMRNGPKNIGDTIAGEVAAMTVDTVGTN